MQKKYLALLCLALTISMVITPANADWVIGGIEVYTFRASNAVLNGIDYNTTAKILRFVISSNNRSTFNIGLACIEIAFNKTHAPAAIPASVKAYLIIDNVTYKLINMVKNVTFVQDAVFVNWNANYTRECFFLQGYVYLFENHTIIDESSMESYILWNRGIFNEGEVPLTNPFPSNTTLPTNTTQPFMSAQQDTSMLVSDGPSVAVLINYIESASVSPIIIGLIAGIGAGVVVVLILFLVKRRQIA